MRRADMPKPVCYAMINTTDTERFDKGNQISRSFIIRNYRSFFVSFNKISLNKYSVWFRKQKQNQDCFFIRGTRNSSSKRN